MGIIPTNSKYVRTLLSLPTQARALSCIWLWMWSKGHLGDGLLFMLSCFPYLAITSSTCLSLCHIEEPILVFRRNAFLSLKEEKRLIAKKNSKVALDLLYHEVSVAPTLSIPVCTLHLHGCLFSAAGSKERGGWPLPDGERWPPGVGWFSAGCGARPV